MNRSNLIALGCDFVVRDFKAIVDYDRWANQVGYVQWAAGQLRGKDVVFTPLNCFTFVDINGGWLTITKGGKEGVASMVGREAEEYAALQRVDGDHVVERDVKHRRFPFVHRLETEDFQHLGFSVDELLYAAVYHKNRAAAVHYLELGGDADALHPDGLSTAAQFGAEHAPVVWTAAVASYLASSQDEPAEAVSMPRPCESCGRPAHMGPCRL